MLPFELTKDTPYLALSGELWSVFCEYFNRNWPCYKGFLLYMSPIWCCACVCILLRLNELNTSPTVASHGFFSTFITRIKAMALYYLKQCCFYFFNWTIGGIWIKIHLCSYKNMNGKCPSLSQSQCVKPTKYLLLRRVPGIILSMDSGKGKRRYIVITPLVGWAHTQIDPWVLLRGLGWFIRYKPVV